MSELERNRALTLVTVIAATLLALFAYQSRGGAPQEPKVRDSLELCAASKGALCDDDVVVPAERLVSKSELVELGQIVVTAPRASGFDAREAVDQVGLLGSITVVAPRFEGSRVAESADDGARTRLAAKS